MTTAAIIVAAGSGQRFGDAGKSFTTVNGKPMAWWSLQTAAQTASIDEIVLVCGAHSHAMADELVSTFPAGKPLALVLGGDRRQDSALAGIEATSAATTLVAIHDAARPLVSCKLLDAVVAAAGEHGAAIAATPVSDTIKRVAGGRVIETVPRDELVSVQTPQAFHKQSLLDAFALAERLGRSVTDEAALIELAGGQVVVVPGSSVNFKVTYPQDLLIAETLLRGAQR